MSIVWPKPYVGYTFDHLTLTPKEMVVIEVDPGFGVFFNYAKRPVTDDFQLPYHVFVKRYMKPEVF